MPTVWGGMGEWEYVPSAAAVCRAVAAVSAAVLARIHLSWYPGRGGGAYQYPLSEQHSNFGWKHWKPLVPPQLLSGDSFEPAQVPNRGWQPPPQWAGELPL